MTHAPLATIGAIEITPKARRHRFYQEALACAQVRDDDDRERVVGTANTRACELYGWAPHVPEHVDGFGYTYLVCLNEGKTSICLRDGEAIDEVWAPSGAVIRLDDRFAHWTSDDGPRVAAFVGTFGEPCDDEAIDILRCGIAALVRGDYHGAPRVRTGFRIILEDECWAASPTTDEIDTALIVDATAQGLTIAHCSLCERPAVRPDPYWPYEQQQSRCAEHLHTGA